MTARKRIMGAILGLCIAAGAFLSIGASAEEGVPAVAQNGDNISGYSAEEGYDYVYFGKYDGEIIRWRVLDDRRRGGNDDGFLLLSENVLFKEQALL